MDEYINCVWSTSRLGDYYGNAISSRAYIPIVKNQTSTIIPNLGPVYYPMSVFEEGGSNKKYICILREPLERYISGICEYIRGPGTLNRVIKGWTEGEFIFGKHTEPQHWSLIPFINENVKYIWFSNTSSEEVLDFLYLKNTSVKCKNKSDGKLLRDVERSVLLVEDLLHSFLKQDYYYIDKYINE